MITYRKGFFGLPLLLHFAGTSWPSGVVPALLSAGIGAALGHVRSVESIVSDHEAFLDNPYPFQLFAYLVGFVMVFRTNFAYQRYWEALDAVQRMASKWFDGACMAIAFDAPGDATCPYLIGNGLKMERPADKQLGPTHEEFFSEMAHLFSLLHALALLHLRCDRDLGNLEAAFDQRELRMTGLGTAPISQSTRNHYGGLSIFTEANLRAENRVRKLRVLGSLSPGELAALSNDSSGAEVPTIARVTMVLSWIMRRLIARQKYEPMGDMHATSPPILSRLYQVVSDGHLGFSQAAKVADTPFPFPYHNLIRIFLWMYAFSVPFVINAKVFQNVARFVVNFLAVWSYFALCEVGDNLEDPFLPYDPNELPLQAIQHSFNARLLSLNIVPRQSGADKNSAAE